MTIPTATIPLPKPQKGPKPTYPMRELKVGESFAVKLGSRDPTSVAGSFYKAAKGIGIKIATRRDRKKRQLRIWRIA